jgi:hypothetical protein
VKLSVHWHWPFANVALLRHGRKSQWTPTQPSRQMQPAPKSMPWTHRTLHEQRDKKWQTTPKRPARTTMAWNDGAQLANDCRRAPSDSMRRCDALSELERREFTAGTTRNERLGHRQWYTTYPRQQNKFRVGFIYIANISTPISPYRTCAMAVNTIALNHKRRTKV